MHSAHMDGGKRASTSKVRMVANSTPICLSALPFWCEVAGQVRSLMIPWVRRRASTRELVYSVPPSCLTKRTILSVRWCKLTSMILASVSQTEVKDAKGMTQTQAENSSTTRLA